jgi:hypothetical protein
MASTCIQQKANHSPLPSVSDYGLQTSRLLAGACFCCAENGEILDSDDVDLPTVSESLARPRRAQVQTRPRGQVIDLTCDGDDDDTEVSWHIKPPRRARHPIELTRPHRQATPSLSTRFLRPLLTSSSHELTYSTHEFSWPCSAAALPGGKKTPCKNPPPWSLLYYRHQLTLTLPASEPPSCALHTDTDNAEPILTTARCRSNRGLSRQTSVRLCIALC